MRSGPGGWGMARLGCGRPGSLGQRGRAALGLAPPDCPAVMLGHDGMLEDVATRLISPVFIGRGAELADLETAFAAAGRGESATVLFGGEAGVGKSRLATEFAGHVRAA